MRGMLLANHGVFRRGRTQGTALDIRAHVGTSLSPTATGNRAVTGVGFQPKAVLPFGVINPSEGANTSAVLHAGAGISTNNEASIAVVGVNAATTSSTWRRHSNAGVISNVNGVGITDFASDLNALGADGFTLNWSTVLATERILNHICLGGADLEVSLTQHQMNATNAPQSFAHGLSGAPTGLMFFSAHVVTTPPGTLNVALMSMGSWSSGSQFGSILRSSNGLTTTLTRRALNTNCVLGNLDGSGNYARTLGVSSVDSANVNCTYPVTAFADQFFFYMLAIRGARCQVGTFDCNDSTSPLTINTPGITPRLFLPVFLPGGVDNVNTVQNGLAITIGASDGTRNVSCGITDANTQTTTNARRYQSSTSFEEYLITAGTFISRATASFSGESVVITPTVNTDSNFLQGGYLVIGS